MITNREYLNTLSDEEYISKTFELQHRCDWCKEVRPCNNKCHNNKIAWLQAEHITTADEDFAEIGFVLEITQPLYVCYADDNGRLLYILKFNNEYDTNNEGWNDELINTVRTIANKKRKEMGCGE